MLRSSSWNNIFSKRYDCCRRLFASLSKEGETTETTKNERETTKNERETTENDLVKVWNLALDQHPSVSFTLMQRLFRKRFIRVVSTDSITNTPTKPKRVSRWSLVDSSAKVVLPKWVNEIAAASRVTVEWTPELEQQLQRMILFEDDRVMVLNKTAGLAVQGGTGLGNHHLDAILSTWSIEKQKQCSTIETPKIVHRLDKDVTGVLVFAKTKKYARIIADAFKNDQVQKEYVAVVAGLDPGVAEQGVINMGITGKEDSWNSKDAIEEEEEDEDGIEDDNEEDNNDGRKTKAAVTHYKVLSRGKGDVALLELKPQTGRKHQLRIHCALGLNAPIVGETKYANNNNSNNNSTVPLQLHARKIVIELEDRLQVVAPLPVSMTKFLKHQGIDAKMIK